MGSQLRWLERTPDKREVDGSIPFEPTKLDKESSNSTLKNIQIKLGKLEFNRNIKSSTQFNQKTVIGLKRSCELLQCKKFYKEKRVRQGKQEFLTEVVHKYVEGKNLKLDEV